MVVIGPAERLPLAHVFDVIEIGRRLWGELAMVWALEVGKMAGAWSL
jgi:hypothetical protein